jgi:hypothetical protein
MLEPNVGADAPKRELSVDPLRDEIEAYRNVVNVVNAVNAMEALLSTTPPDRDKLQKAASVKVEREDWPQWRAP